MRDTLPLIPPPSCIRPTPSLTAGLPPLPPHVPRSAFLHAARHGLAPVGGLRAEAVEGDAAEARPGADLGAVEGGRERGVALGDEEHAALDVLSLGQQLGAPRQHDAPPVFGAADLLDLEADFVVDRDELG